VRRICAFSGKRGGYGAYLPLMRVIEEDPKLELLILLSDMHASPVFGLSVEEVRADFPTAHVELVDIGTGVDDSRRTRAINLGRCLTEVTKVLDRCRPEIVLVHGDRAEHLVVALAALTLGMAVAHTQGGDRSGNVDEIQRHSISKLAHVHFPETEDAAERLGRLGEDPWRIHTVGSLYIDRIVQGLFAPSLRARRTLGLAPDEPFLLLLVHPESYADEEANERMATRVFAAAAASGMRSVVTYPCSDPGYDGVLRALRSWETDDRFIIRRNIENDVYLALLSSASALVGNSSAGVVEAPYFQLPVVNVGGRQRGRFRPANLIDADVDSVAVALARACDPAFRRSLPKGGHLGDGHAAERVVEILRDLELNRRLLEKELAY
jgi:GDP/UDP-N,N'-diacetylbacillosamine 2-epimerase (hydrolysing)